MNQPERGKVGFGLVNVVYEEEGLPVLEGLWHSQNR